MRAVLSAVLSGNGGVKVLIFFVTSNLFISTSFRAGLTIEIFKIIFMIRTIDWRAETARPPSQPCKKSTKSPYYGYIW